MLASLAGLGPGAPVMGGVSCGKPSPFDFADAASYQVGPTISRFIVDARFCPTEQCLHDLRQIAATKMAEAGFPRAPCSD